MTLLPATDRKLADAFGVDPEDLMERETTAASDGTAQPAIGIAAGWNGRLAAVDAPEVNRLLHENPALAALVAEAADQLGTFFPDACICLELLTDPDYGDDEQLFLGVSTNLEESEAVEALQRFDREWWVRNAGRGRGRLCIDLNEA